MKVIFRTESQTSLLWECIAFFIDVSSRIWQLVVSQVLCFPLWKKKNVKRSSESQAGRKYEDYRITKKTFLLLKVCQLESTNLGYHANIYIASTSQVIEYARANSLGNQINSFIPLHWKTFYISLDGIMKVSSQCSLLIQKKGERWVCQ